MIILNNPISRTELKEYAANTFGEMIKCVADVDQGLLAIDADFIEYDSLINIRSWQGNPVRDVLDQEVREKIAGIVNKFITD